MNVGWAASLDAPKALSEGDRLLMRGVHQSDQIKVSGDPVLHLLFSNSEAKSCTYDKPVTASDVMDVRYVQFYLEIMVSACYHAAVLFTAYSLSWW